jgi:hypothetical protein
MALSLGNGRLSGMERKSPDREEQFEDSAVLREAAEIVEAERADRPKRRFGRLGDEPSGEDAAEAVAGDGPTQALGRAPVLADGKGAIGKRLRFFDGDDHGDDFQRGTCSVVARDKSNIDANGREARAFAANAAKAAVS